jgi:hypothetical protein
MKNKVLEYLDAKFDADEYNLFDEECESFEIEIETNVFMIRLIGMSSCNFFKETGGDWDETLIGCTNQHIEVEELELFDKYGIFVETNQDYINKVQLIINQNL